MTALTITEMSESTTARDELRALGCELTASGFSAETAADLVGASGPEDLLSNPRSYSYFFEETPGSMLTSRSEVLTWLFVLNKELEADAAEAVLGLGLSGTLTRLGLLAVTGGRCRGTVSITPYKSRFFLSDQLFASHGPQQITPASRPDLVMPPHAASLLALDPVASLSGRFLDVGCGSGFLALNASPACRQVSGMDINPRCVSFATANAALNGAKAEFFATDFATLSLPVSERYDSFLFNAPTLPRIRATDSEVGQTTAQQLLTLTMKVAPRVLRPGGLACVQTLVEVPSQFDSAAAAIRYWLRGTTVTSLSVTEVDAPHLTVTRRQLRTRRLHGRSLLVTSHQDAGLLVSALVERGIGQVVFAVVRIRT